MRPDPHPPGHKNIGKGGNTPERTTRGIVIATRPRTTIMQKDKEVGNKEGKACGRLNKAYRSRPTTIVTITEAEQICMSAQKW
ncbi:hypothetical protein PoB_001378400 [Plakobranchus ocellatus]|uniref:Uncharacterized protein n=1 Tax=Plakobranchus ocellatus TaxID=259542 RepID=A0AAV3YZS1_9GAST|nr:hypothetical protein PoB_001378400 [Plakobranchus ocellatus]